MSMPTFLATWGQMAYCDSEDSGDPFLFLHGTGCDASDWQPVIEKLPSAQRCIALDFRGHGRSSVPTQSFTLTDLADDALQLLDYLEIRKAVLVGHSLGGMVAMAVATHSERVTGLVLLEGWTCLSAAGSAFHTGRFYGSLSESAITKIQRKAAATRNRFHPEVWQDFWESVKDFDGYPYLERASIPIYEVFGSSGRNDLTDQRLCIPSNRNIQCVWVPDAGHYLPQERPSEVAKIVDTVSVP